MLCLNCGQEIIDGAAFCTNCGTAVSAGETVEEAVDQAIEETVEQVVEVEAIVSPEEAVEAEVVVSPEEAVEDADVVVAAVEDVAVEAESDNAVEVAEEADAYAAEAASSAAGELAPEYEQMVESLEAAVQANEETIRPIAEHAEAEEAIKTQGEQAVQQDQVVQQPQADQVAQQAQAAGVGAAGAAATVGAAGAAVAGAQASQASQAPEPPQGAQPTGYTMPFYQQGASPNAHYSSQRSYEQDAYGQNTGEPGQPSQAWQQAQQAARQVWPPQSATKRAFMMTLYVSGLIGLIICLLVRDQDDEFITHHLNNNVVLCIGFIISALTSMIFIGMILGIYLLVMVIMGMVSAYNGDMNELPLIGKIHIVK